MQRFGDIDRQQVPFWKPELSYGGATLDTLLDGGLYLETITREDRGLRQIVSDYARRARRTNLEQLTGQSRRSGELYRRKERL